MGRYVALCGVCRNRVSNGSLSLESLLLRQKHAWESVVQPSPRAPSNGPTVNQPDMVGVLREELADLKVMTMRLVADVERGTPRPERTVSSASTAAAAACSESEQQQQQQQPSQPQQSAQWISADENVATV